VISQLVTNETVILMLVNQSKITSRPITNKKKY